MIRTCAVLGCDRPATVRARAASGERFYCAVCVEAARQQVAQPMLFDDQDNDLEAQVLAQFDRYQKALDAYHAVIANDGQNAPRRFDAYLAAQREHDAWAHLEEQAHDDEAGRRLEEQSAPRRPHPPSRG